MSSDAYVLVRYCTNSKYVNKLPSLRFAFEYFDERLLLGRIKLTTGLVLDH